MTFPTFGVFMTKLQDAFKAVNPIDSAMQKLALLQQGNRPVEEMITDFMLLIGDARLFTDSPSNQIHLIKMFMTCLNPQLKKKIIFGDIVPKTIEDWYTKAIQYDSNYQLAQALMALDNQSPKKNTGKSWFNQNQRPQLLGDTLWNCLSQTTILRHILRHTLRLSHVPIHLIFPHTVGNSIPVEWLYLCDSLWLSVTLRDYLRDYLRHGLRHVLYYSIVLLLSLFFYLYNLTLILAEVLSYSFRTSC